MVRLVREQLVEAVDGRADAHVDLVGNAGTFPEWPANVDKGVLDVAADELTVLGESQGEAKRRVSGEDANLDTSARTSQLHLHLHPLALVGRRKHGVLPVQGLLCDRAQFPLQVRNRVHAVHDVLEDCPISHNLMIYCLR